MPSIFENVTKNVVKEVDAGGDMIAVRSFLDADKLRCFALVRGKKSFWGWRYYTTNLSLQDVLEESCDELDTGLPGQMVEYQKQEKEELELKVKLFQEEITVSGFHGSEVQKAKMAKKSIPQKFLESLENKKLKKELPFSFRTFMGKEVLFLVTETLETEEKQTCREEQNYFWKLIWKCIFKYIDEEAGGHEPRRPEQGICGMNSGNSTSWVSKSERQITIPSKQVLCYRIKQLVQDQDTISINFSDTLKPSIIGEGKDVGSSSLGKAFRLEDSRNIKEWVQDMERSLQDLTEKEQNDMLSSLTKCLSEEGHLRDLEQRVSEVLYTGELLREDEDLLITSLYNTAGHLVQARVEAIKELLDALMEVSEEHQFVAKALQEGILPDVKKEVKNTLETNGDEKLSNPQDMGCDPTRQKLWALYVAVSMLLQLSKK